MQRMNEYEAFIFDLNGTMIDDMHYHEVAWYDVLVNRLKAPLSLEEVKLQLYGKSNEMFGRIFGNKFSKEEIVSITDLKEIRYREEFLPHLKSMAGLEMFLDKARSKNIALAIGTAAPILNVNFAIDNLDLRKYFPVIVGPDDVVESKPHPEVFLKAAERLRIAPEKCVVFEDAPKGIEAAARAGMKAVAVTSYHSADELKNKNVLFTIDNYTNPKLSQLIN
jgi:HAD superfamily hydrolase (TIGR01509 family)